MIEANFNKNFKNFKEKSKAYAAALLAFHAEAGFKDKTASPERLRALDASFEVVFETAVIFGALAPQQASLVMRERQAAQFHEFHSATTRREFKAASAKSTGVDPMALDFGVAATRLVLSRPAVAKMLDTEIQAQMVEDQAPPPLIKRRFPRA